MLTYDQAVKELYSSLFGSNPTNYHALLFQLIQKADPQHLKLLRAVYPMEVKAWEEWTRSAGSVEFFKRFGLEIQI